MIWDKLTTEEIKECSQNDYVVVIPCGAIEQHGAHLPVDTDSHIAWEIATRIGATQDRILVAPLLNIGFSPHHMGLHGTISYSFETFASVIHDVCQSIVNSGFNRIVFLNAHGGNASFLKARALSLSIEFNIKILVITYMDFIRDDLETIRESESGGISHACELETSLQLYLSKPLVKVDKIKKNIVQPALSYIKKDSSEKPKAYLPLPYKHPGVNGDPTLATEEKGKKIMEVIVSSVGEAIAEFRDTEF
mgnify:CR=1 FL=1